MATASNSWSVDLNLRESDVGHDVLLKCPPTPGVKGVASYEKSPPSSGAANSTAVDAKSAKAALALKNKKQARAMTLATSPGKQILMNGFMMWMSGKNLNIFSISITSMALLNPLKSIFTLNQTFRSLEDPDGNVDLSTAKALFVALNLVWFAVGLWKMGTMRLLPTTSGDWAGRVLWKETVESSCVPPQ